MNTRTEPSQPTQAVELEQTAEPDQAAPDTGQQTPVAKPKRRSLLVGTTALALALTGATYILSPASSQSTDNAYISADSLSVAPKVSGLVAQVLVQDNQLVQRGEPLVRIDPEEFDARVLAADAGLADARAGVVAAQAALESLDAEERLAATNVRAADTAIRAAKAEAQRAQADRRRYDELAVTGAVAASDVDAYRTAAISAEQEVARVSAMLDIARDRQAVTGSRRAGLEAALQKARAQQARAEASLELARQNRQHAEIVAAVDGIVGNRQVQQGDYVQPGTRLMTLVPLHERYVTANFKETQTGRIAPGQPAQIEIDALPGRAFLGTVESLAPGTGSSFALLPFEPGTGNFTKIVQRVPVRIRFDPDQDDLDLLRPGLSVTVEVALQN